MKFIKNNDNNANQKHYYQSLSLHIKDICLVFLYQKKKMCFLKENITNLITTLPKFGTFREE